MLQNTSSMHTGGGTSLRLSQTPHMNSHGFTTAGVFKSRPSECFCAAPKQIVNFECRKFNSNKSMLNEIHPEIF
jgi:hypothetical protein